MTFDLNPVPTDSAYLKLIEAAAKHCPLFIFVVRDGMALSEGGKRVIKEIEGEIVDVEKTNRWPGTVLHKGAADVYRVRLNDRSRAVLERYSTGLSDWLQPNLPEDLCFLKDRVNPWLTSISHEGFFYFTSKNDMEELLSVAPEFSSFISVS